MGSKVYANAFTGFRPEKPMQNRKHMLLHFEDFEARMQNEDSKVLAEVLGQKRA